MKGRKKALAASIVNAIQNKLSESGILSKKESKAIEKAAKKLADKLNKILVKEKKKQKEIKKNEEDALRADKKEMIKSEYNVDSEIVTPELR